MKLEYGHYDTAGLSVVDTAKGEGSIVFPANVNPFKVHSAECFRNASNKVIVSLKDENSTLYTFEEWQSLLANAFLQQAHENKIEEMLNNAMDAMAEFLEKEKYEPLPVKKLDRKLIRNCSWGYSCKKTWDSLSVTDFEKVRFCTDCNNNVIKCITKEDLLKNIELNHCVCFPSDLISDISEERRDNLDFDGIPF